MHIQFRVDDGHIDYTTYVKTTSIFHPDFLAQFRDALYEGFEYFHWFSIYKNIWVTDLNQSCVYTRNDIEKTSDGMMTVKVAAWDGNHMISPEYFMKLDAGHYGDKRFMFELSCRIKADLGSYAWFDAFTHVFVSEVGTLKGSYFTREELGIEKIFSFTEEKAEFPVINNSEALDKVSVRAILAPEEYVSQNRLSYAVLDGSNTIIAKTHTLVDAQVLSKAYKGFGGRVVSIIQE